MRLPSPALVLSCVAVFLSAAGGAVAANQINGKQIKDGSITGKDIRNDSLTATDIKGDVRGPAGPAGPRGPQGVAGSGGPVGSAGGPAVSYRLAVATVTPGEESRRVYAMCPAGQVPTGGSHRAQPGLEVAWNEFGDSTSQLPDSWTVLVDNPTANPLQITVYVACVRPGTVSGF